MSQFNQPLSGNDMPRFAGNASMFRLPVQESAAGLDVAIVGVPLDIGTSNRNGTRYGPRQIRSESVLVRPYGMATGAAPFDSFQIADTGDVALNPYSLEKSIGIIEAHYDALLEHDVIPVSLGGDHTVTLPILRALARKHGPLGLVHVDAHPGQRLESGALRCVVDGDSRGGTHPSRASVSCLRCTPLGLRRAVVHGSTADRRTATLLVLLRVARLGADNVRHCFA